MPSVVLPSSSQTRSGHGRHLLACAALALSLSACSFFQANTTVRGNPVDADSLKQLIPGTSTTADATALLGSPTAHETFNENSWVYISQITRPRVGRLPGVVTQHVVVLAFDPNGTLTTVRSYDKADARSVSMAPGSTPSPGSSASILQQLFGNIGRFSGASKSGASGGLAGSALNGN